MIIMTMAIMTVAIITVAIMTVAIMIVAIMTIIVTMIEHVDLHSVVHGLVKVVDERGEVAVVVAAPLEDDDHEKCKNDRRSSRGTLRQKFNLFNI